MALSNPARQGQAKTDSINGKVNKILFRNAENGFSIVSIKSTQIPDFAKKRSYPNQFTAKGIFLQLAEGQHLTLSGKWDKDKQYGWGFLVDTYTEEAPNSKEAMVEYLSCGLFKGIGEKTAQNLVKHFGREVVDIIRKNPQELSKVQGISSRKAQNIADSYKASEHLEKLMLSLKPYKISTKKINKIYQQYGEKSMERIVENPYQLCQDVEGIGFLVADAIGSSCNISPNNEHRIQSALLHTLNVASMAEGHAYLPFDLLIEKTQAVLEKGAISGKVAKNDLVRIAVDLNNQEEIILEQDSAAYLPLMIGSEKFVANKIRLMGQQKEFDFPFPLKECLSEMEKKNKIKYAEKQREAFQKTMQNNMLIITGGPGTGKTTIIKGIVDLYKKNFPGCKIELAAPTGRAAKRMTESTKLPAKTIHRMLEYRPSDEGGIRCGRDESNPIEAKVIIVDESSMIDILLMTSLLKAVKNDTALIFVGDTDQLPSVGPGNVLKDMINSQKIPTVFLNEIFRQAGTSKIIINADKINRGENELEYDDDFQIIEAKTEEIPSMIEKVYMKELQRLGDLNDLQLVTPFRRKTDAGVDALNKQLQEVVNPKKGEELKYGFQTFRAKDKVMQYRNNYEKDIYNGDVGTVDWVDRKNNEMEVRIEDEPIYYSKEDLDEIQLAYATTIHKSQGCEYDTIIIPLSIEHKRMLQRNLIYTGITRAKTKVILVGEKRALNYAIKNNNVNARFSKLVERI